MKQYITNISKYNYIKWEYNPFNSFLAASKKFINDPKNLAYLKNKKNEKNVSIFFSQTTLN